MTDAELREWSRERLAYEVEMVLFGGHALATLPPRRTTRSMIEKNAQLDAFAVHARALLAFFYGGRSRPDDVIADDFMVEAALWHAARPPIPATLTQARNRTHKEVAT